MTEPTRDFQVLGNRTWALQRGSGLLIMDPGFDCSSLSLDEALQRPESTLSKTLALVNARKPRWVYLFLSHDHYDHAGNLPLFTELRGRHDWNMTLLAHEKNQSAQRAKRQGFPSHLIDGDSSLALEPEDVKLLATPGHNLAGDDISLWLPRSRVLFAGDLPQAQGPCYECCDFHSAFSNHQNGEQALHSLQKLHGLPFETLLMGHEGQALGKEEGKRAIKTTMVVLERTRDLAFRLVSENPRESRERYVEWIYDTISWERRMPLEQSERRKEEGHRGPCPRRDSRSFYHLYDTASIYFFVDRAMALLD